MPIIPNFEQAEAQSGESHPWAVKSGTAASITVGDVVIEDTANPGYAKAVGTAELTDQDTVIGPASTTSTETASADGVVMVADEKETQVWRARTVGTPTQAQVNTIVTITSASDGTQKINEDNPNAGVAKIIDFNATAGTVDFKFINQVAGAGQLKAIQQTFALADFTDGGGAAGTASFTDALPLGAVVEQTLIDDITGFIGDTTAVVTVGDGTDVDRYNTGTPSVFATIAAIDAGVPSGTKFHAAAKTPVVTVTGGADFTSITAGAVKVTILYYEA